MSVSVCGADADLLEFRHLEYDFCETDVQVWLEYASESQCALCARRLDAPGGWPDRLRALVVDRLGGALPRVVDIGPSESNERRLLLFLGRPLAPGAPLALGAPYHHIPAWRGEPKRLSRADFNARFAADVAVLPSSLAAVDYAPETDELCVYTEDAGRLHDVLPTLRHLARVARAESPPLAFNCIVCASDGYMESQRSVAGRHKPRRVGDAECAARYLFGGEADDEYAVYGRARAVLGQSVHAAPFAVPYTLAVVDRHFFYHNLYNAFRSFHRGIPFSQKIAKVVYGGQARGDAFNFTARRDIALSPREYFASAAVPKSNVVSGGWIDRADQVGYKYVLDIDGHAATWDATAWKLNSGSVVFRAASRWSQWFHADYRAGEHYVPLRDDFADLDEKFAWCEAHPRECERIVANCQRLFQKTYRMSAVMAHTRATLRALAEHADPL